MFLLLFALSLLLFFIYHTLQHHKQNQTLPPGSLGWLPFLGDTLSFIAPHLSTTKGDFLESNIKRYGKIFRSHLFGRPSIVSCDGDFNSFILQNEDRLFQSCYPANIPGILGDITMLVATGDYHKRLRGVALSLFATIKAQNSAFLSDIEDNALFIMDSWRNKDSLIFCQQARKFTFTVIAKQILSLGPEDPRTALIFTSFQTFMKGLVSMPINFPGTPYARAIQERHRIQGIARNILHDRRSGRDCGDRKVDFLDAMMMHEELEEQEMLSMVLDLLLGGYETTAMLISVIVRFLSDNPKALKELKDEQERVRRNKGSNERLGWDDFLNMTFTHDLINESLRCGNIVKFVHRKSIKPIHYKGYEIPAGWKVLPIFSGVHLDSTLHSNPLEFNPWRWQKEEMMEMKGSKHFMPFGGGRRQCPGYELARVETAFFLHHLVLNFKWTNLRANDQPMAFPYVDFKHGLQISIHPLANSTIFANKS